MRFGPLGCLNERKTEADDENFEFEMCEREAGNAIYDYERGNPSVGHVRGR